MIIIARGGSCGHYKGQPIARWIMDSERRRWTYMGINLAGRPEPGPNEHFLGDLIYRLEV